MKLRKRGANVVARDKLLGSYWFVPIDLLIALFYSVGFAEVIVMLLASTGLAYALGVIVGFLSSWYVFVMLVYYRLRSYGVI